MAFLGIGKKILCPFCFNEINTSKVHYMCSAGSCNEVDTNGRIRTKKDGTPMRHIIRNAKPKGGFCACDVCKRTTSKKVCPLCESLLPDNIMESDTKIVSIVGAKGSGKSYFVATLLKQILDEGLLARNMSASCRPATQESLTEYKIRFKDNLDKGKILAGTNPSVTDLIKEYPPILVELKYDVKGKFRTNTFSFFDAAGEKFENEADLAAITPYLAHSLAVVIILDPRQIPKLDASLNDLGYDGEGSEITYSHVLDNTISVIRTGLKKITGKVDIPLCVAISKWDLVTKIPGLIDDSMIISGLDKDTNGYNSKFVDAASEELRSLILEWEPNLVNTAENNFENVKYFAFSAWGFSENGVPGKAAYKVEDPFMWVLKNQK